MWRMLQLREREDFPKKALMLGWPNREGLTMNDLTTHLSF